MVENNGPARPRRRRLAPLLGLALAGGAILGGAGVYVGQSGPGNAATAANCPANPRLAQAIDAAARGEVAAVRPLDAPFDARAIAFTDETDTAKRVADFSGKTLLVNVWATWCVPCRAEMPALDRLQRERGGADFAVVPVSVDLGDAEKPKRFYEETGLTSLPLYRDETMGVFNDMKAKGIGIGLPLSLIVDGEGCARAAITGPAEWASPDAFNLIDAVRRPPA